MKVWNFCKIRLLRCPYIILILFSCALLWFLFLIFPLTNNEASLSSASLVKSVEQACQRPELEVYHPIIAKHIIDEGKLKCATDPDWLYLSNGSVHICPEANKKFGPYFCTLSYYKRLTDFKSEIGFLKTLKSIGGHQELVADFFTAECRNKHSKTFESILAGIHRKTLVFERAAKAKRDASWTNLSVLMIGFDSMSRLHYMRKLPKSYDFITRELGGVVLEGYNIVGDGTPQALIPILTGQVETELPETRKRIEKANYVNVYPFIWNNFSEAGYVTAFAEDTPNTGIFTYRLTGFKEQPTDHYMRPFYVESENVIRNHHKYCLGNIPKHKVMLNWGKQLFQVYKQIPKFAFLFHGELSHDDFNLVQYADEDLVDLLSYLKAEGHLDSTLLILMSDHGHRFSNIRDTQQGKQEERLPFFSIVPPTSFKEKYQKLYKNLVTNSKRLTTPFDIYPTLLTVLNSNIPVMGDLNSRGISLFSEIPLERSCAHAGIESHWCTCLTWEEVSVKDPTAKEAAQAVIDFINEYTKSFSPLCAQLVLDKVTKAERHMPNPALLKYKKNIDKDGFVADLSDKTEVSEDIYQVQFVVFPSQGMYEASVKHKALGSSFHIHETEISRVNLYGNQPDCVQEKFPNLRKYCYCKAHLA